jgi:hypothetical protein
MRPVVDNFYLLQRGVPKKEDESIAPLFMEGF